MKRLLSVLHARNLEFIRDRSALAWTVFMPFFLVIAFAIIFSGDDRTLYKVGYIGSFDQVQSESLEFFQTEYIKVIPFDDQNTALDKLKHHQIDLLLQTQGKNFYWLNDSSPNGYMLERVLRGTGGDNFTKQTIESEEIRYIDWVLPGILSFNIMMGCLFGVGYVIVRYRKNGYLKRLKVTPLTPLEFLSAQMLSRLLLMLSISVLVFIGCDIFIDFVMYGSYALLFLIALLGSICMISLGLMVAAKIASEELAGGLLNLLTWPMMILSGVWFSLEGAHPLIQSFAQILPLTHLVDGARAIMTEGAGLAEIWINLLVLGVMSIVFLLVGAKIFRWE